MKLYEITMRRVVFKVVSETITGAVDRAVKAHLQHHGWATADDVSKVEVKADNVLVAE